ncbi:hypothetical protein PTSG_06507 [Salpingoeca rosetta]|uniref:Uncharacterized protein n=1 Tax=Salpingoeca rosetta (strain ATCC 50818 / BSB-021) TaxID=946362 RepID=F2UG04_SALR5|nr:uncharacterized protein PTSG_06507 [Salpingoeca rosetta]EGD75432.1 hypothetical protein PTSG_06507 [Salpingoeca rosetta]|eukprot:XP_004991889.1 hypothetical protein PTSG_06507 [Salpingoeca rosetta]
MAAAVLPHDQLVNSAGRRKRRTPTTTPTITPAAADCQHESGAHTQHPIPTPCRPHAMMRRAAALANSRSSRSPAAPPSTPSRLFDGAFADPLHLHCWYPCARSTTTIVNIISSINPSPLGEPSPPSGRGHSTEAATAHPAEKRTAEAQRDNMVPAHVAVYSPAACAAAGDAGDTNDGNNNDNNINSVNDDGNSDNDGWNQHPLERSPMIGAHASAVSLMGAVETFMVMINSIMGRDSRRSLLHVIVNKRPIGWLLSLFPFPTAESNDKDSSRSSSHHHHQQQQ